MHYVISYQEVSAQVVDADTYEDISARYPETQVLKTGSERKCNKYVEEINEIVEKIELNDYDTTD